MKKRRPIHMGRTLPGQSHKHEQTDSNRKWHLKKRLITAAAWIIGASLMASGLYLLISGGGIFSHIIGGVIFLAGASLIAFSWELRKWILLKW
jgi:hypothetical protein